MRINTRVSSLIGGRSKLMFEPTLRVSGPGTGSGIGSGHENKCVGRSRRVSTNDVRCSAAI